MERRTGPYLRSPVTIESTMRDVLISLLPALAAGVVFFGLRALWLVILSTAAAMVTEMLLLRRPFTREGLFGDGSAAVTGVLVGLILPSTASWWVPVVGSIIAIAVVKLPFGGLGYNIFNPALGARAILLLAFTSQMVRFALPFDTVTGATPLLTMTSFDWSLIWGNVGGSIGETSVIAILLGAAYLFYKGHIDWRIPVGYVGAAFVMALLWGLNPWITVFAGGLLFGAVFMATDMVTSPVTPMGQLLFGIGCGVLTVFIRKFTSLPEGVTFAILGMNALVPILDKLTMPQRFGVGIPREQRFQGTAVGVVVTAAVVLLAVIIATPGQEIQPVFSGPHYLPIVEMLGTSDYSVEEINGTRYYTVRDGEGTLKAAVFAAEQRGFHGPIQFLVALDDQFAITDLRVLEHKEDPGLGALVAKPDFLSQFVGLNVDSAFSLGTDVDGISGATISSRAMATGVRRALEGFMDAFFPTTEAAAGWSDGVYTGVADSFGGPLTVEVVVTNGQIADVRVLSSSDTPGISDGAIANVPGRIVAANSPKVDAYSGATVTSEAIMSAVEKALSQAAADVMAGWPDGTYTGSAAGFSGQVEVEVTVSGGQIIDVRVVSHSDTPGISDSAINAIPGRIVEANSPDVDVVSGATYTSEGIIAAVRNALDSQASAGEAPAEQPSSAVGFDIKVSDGTYRAVGKGFGGDLVVDVTVAGGKINAISVVEHADTPFLADPAIEALVPAILDAQGVVDVYSGATMTSKGLFEAVEKAVSGEGAAAAKVEPFDIKVSDGTYRGVGKGFGGDLVVDVTVAGGKINAISVVEHADTPFLADPAIEALVPAILDAQGVVDVYSGATMTSKGLFEAVEKAVSGAGEAEVAAKVEPFDIKVSDGTYRGVGKGFGGDLVVDVTVAGGKITGISVVEHADTPFLADPAIDALVPAILDAQGIVDAYSGATMTSKGLFEAVEKAVSGEGASEAAAEVESFDIKVSDGTYRGVGKGFGGDLVVDVTVAGGKITDIAVVEHADTSFLADPAIDTLVPAILDAQGIVDVYSGATMTSKGLFEAVEKAISGEEGQ